MKKGYKLCPFCGEELREIANKCHFCGEPLEEQHFFTNNKISFKKNENNSNSKSGNVGIIVPLTLIIGIIVFLIVYRLFGNKILELNNQIKNLNLENKKLQDQIIELSEEKEITESFGNITFRTCKGQGIDKIEGYAECVSSSGDTYKGDVRGHNLNGKGIRINSNGDTLDGYFYKGFFIAGKVNWKNGDATKGMWTPQGSGSRIELGKIFRKSNGHILLGDFDENGNLSYGMKKGVVTGLGESFGVGNFTDGGMYNGYAGYSEGCFKVTNGNLNEITRTITNTVYRNNGIQLSNPLGDFYKLGSQYNPYTVNLNVN